MPKTAVRSKRRRRPKLAKPRGRARAHVTVSKEAIEAYFDAAQTPRELRNHWAQVDWLSPSSALSEAVRKTLRARARYEVANNSYARGILLTLADYVIGTGPKLQLLTDDAALNREVEEAFSLWSDAVDLPGKLRTAQMTKAESGEAFLILIDNPRVQNPVQLDLRMVEADHVATPFESVDGRILDGIEYDDHQNPITYHVLKAHPGDRFSHVLTNETQQFAAEAVLHWYRVDRPGQLRGAPEITPSLHLFALLRRYTLAVVMAAEQAALFGGVLESDSPADPDLEVDMDQFDELEFERSIITTIPQGWKLNQFKAEQPTEQYVAFKRALLNEIARCVLMPYNIAAADSSGYNYASGRLDHQSYDRSIQVQRQDCELRMLNRIFGAWLTDAILRSDFLPVAARRLTTATPRRWFWPGLEHVDPNKEAQAQATRLTSNTTTLAAEYARQGRDWETELQQRAREVQRMRELGIPTVSQSRVEEVNDGEEED